MILTYTKITGCGHIDGSDEWEEWGDDFDYEIDWHQEIEALSHILFDEYFDNLAVLDNDNKTKILKAIRAMLADICDDALEYYEKIYKDELLNYFRADAFDAYDSCR